MKSGEFVIVFCFGPTCNHGWCRSNRAADSTPLCGQVPRRGRPRSRARGPPTSACHCEASTHGRPPLDLPQGRRRRGSFSSDPPTPTRVRWPRFANLPVGEAHSGCTRSANVRRAERPCPGPRGITRRACRPLRVAPPTRPGAPGSPIAAGGGKLRTIAALTICDVLEAVMGV